MKKKSWRRSFILSPRAHILKPSIKLILQAAAFHGIRYVIIFSPTYSTRLAPRQQNSLIGSAQAFKFVFCALNAAATEWVSCMTHVLAADSESELRAQVQRGRWRRWCIYQRTTGAKWCKPGSTHTSRLCSAGVRARFITWKKNHKQHNVAQMEELPRGSNPLKICAAFIRS